MRCGAVGWGEVRLVICEAVDHASLSLSLTLALRLRLVVSRRAWASGEGCGGPGRAIGKVRTWLERGSMYTAYCIVVQTNEAMCRPVPFAAPRCRGGVRRGLYVLHSIYFTCQLLLVTTVRAVLDYNLASTVRRTGIVVPGPTGSVT